MLGLIVKVSTFDDIVFKKDLHIFPRISNIQRISLKVRFPPVTRSDLYLETIRYDTIDKFNVETV